MIFNRMLNINFLQKKHVRIFAHIKINAYICNIKTTRSGGNTIKSATML
nr:MAG TPA: hypothetical protein [Bacteriophage sp.]